MIKQRFLGLALSLALLGTFCFASTANAAVDSEAITVSATVADVLILNLNRSSINFGDGLDFLGNAGANSDAVAVCTNPAETGINGARFVSPNVTATVWSNHNYNVGRGFSSTSTNIGDLYTRGWVGSGNYTNCATGAASLGTVVTQPYLGQNQVPGAGVGYTEFYMIDVLVNSPAASYSATITYAVEALP